MKLRNKKTGEIAEIILNLNESLPDAIRRTIEEAGWEETREPLIKDEKIRKAVRAWAEANDVAQIIVFNIVNGYHLEYDELEFAENGGRPKIRFKTNENLDTDKIYTITELCGSEE